MQTEIEIDQMKTDLCADRVIILRLLVILKRRHDSALCILFPRFIQKRFYFIFPENLIVFRLKIIFIKKLLGDVINADLFHCQNSSLRLSVRQNHYTKFGPPGKDE